MSKHDTYSEEMLIEEMDHTLSRPRIIQNNLINTKMELNM